MKLELGIEKILNNFRLNMNISSDAQKIGILGASGSGKSMTLRCIAGIEKPDRGYISLGERMLYDSSKKLNIRPQERGIGYMFQNYALFPTMTVYGNILCGITKDKKDANEICRKYIERFDLKGLENRLPYELSGGQQQRVALVRMLASEPRMVLLDEPFSALDSYLKDRIRRETMTALEEEGIKTIIVSHDRDELFGLCDEIAVIRKGEVLTYGPREQVFSDPVRIEAAKLTGCKNFSDIRKTGDHRFFASEWGTELYTETEISEDIRYIGYRAHDFKPLWENNEDRDNCLKFRPIYEEDLPFGKNYYFNAISEDGKENTLCWIPDAGDLLKIGDMGLPDRLKVLPEKILLLK